MYLECRYDIVTGCRTACIRLRCLTLGWVAAGCTAALHLLSCTYPTHILHNPISSKNKTEGSVDLNRKINFIMNNISLSLFKTLRGCQHDDYYKTQLRPFYTLHLYHNLCSIGAFEAGLSLG